METKPTHRRHNPFHDYSKKCIYHITIVVRGRANILGRVVEMRAGDPSTVCPWDPDAKVWMALSPLGMDVAENIGDIPRHAAQKGLKVRILAQQVMDTHLHFVLFVEEDMDGVVLGDLMRGFKAGCNKAYRSRMADVLYPEGMPATPSRERGTGLFEADYDETILSRRGQLKRMIEYVHQNPYRKWVKGHHRDCFVPTRGIVIAGREYDAIGNLMLLGLRRFQVHCRYRWERDHDVEARRAHQNECVLKARNNYALVSPFISPHEAAVRDVCLKEGHSIIQIVDNGFTDFSTCPGGLFPYCERGQVLLLVPSELPHIDRKGTIARSECAALNARAEEIARDGADERHPRSGG